MSESHIEWLSAGEEAIVNASDTNVELFEKIAQRRSFLQWMHEKANIPRRVTETFAPAYGDVMDTLREVDTRIRSEFANDLKTYVKEAKRANKERRYLDVIHFLSLFNTAVSKISEEGARLHQLSGDQIDSFYGKSQYFDLGQDYFGNKQAGLMDVFDRFTRPMQARVMERMYRNTLRKRIRNMENLVSNAGALLNFVFSKLKEMGSSRARGDVGDYISKLDQIAQRRQAFEAILRQTYDTDIKPMVDRMRAEQEKSKGGLTTPSAPPEAAPAALAPEIPDLEVSLPVQETIPEAPPFLPVQPVPEPPATEPPVQEPMQDVAPEPVQGPQASEPVTKTKGRRAKKTQTVKPRIQPLPEEVEQVAEAMKNDQFVTEFVKQAFAHKKSKQFVADLFLKYSAMLDEFGDVDSSMRCLAIAEGLLNE